MAAHAGEVGGYKKGGVYLNLLPPSTSIFRWFHSKFIIFQKKKEKERKKSDKWTLLKKPTSKFWGGTRGLWEASNGTVSILTSHPSLTLTFVPFHSKLGTFSKIHEMNFAEEIKGCILMPLYCSLK